MKDGFLRVAAHTPSLRVGDCAYNAKQIVQAVQSADADVALHVFPELCLTGATCGDLFLQTALLVGAQDSLNYVIEKTAAAEAVVVVGLPVAVGAAVYNCAAVCCRGELLGIVPKTALSAAQSRWFADGRATEDYYTVAGRSVYFSTQTVFSCEGMPAFRLGVHFGGLWSQSVGATVVASLSAEPEQAGKRQKWHTMVKAQSARLHCAYVLANAGLGESSADNVYAGGSLIADNGEVLCETSLYTDASVAAEVDLEHVLYDRRRNGLDGEPCTEVVFDIAVRPLALTRPVNAMPFVPSTPEARAARCEEVLSIQMAALARRLAHTNSEAVVGLSGGLDSALALLVITRAYEMLGKDPAGITAVTMPCFGTTGRTYRNACTLAQACGATLREVNIAAAVEQHFKDIEHGGAYDVTYENAQARERTQVLMDIANQNGSLVIGTGDLSELVLGWATYNGDHMSMYGVNGSVPKTLVRALVAHVGEHTDNAALRGVLQDILDTPVSPELLPPENGDIAQKTEQIVGNYDLHDFFLYHILRWGSAPARVYRLACTAFEGHFTSAEIKQWLCVFLRRFFAQQFKRNCLPDGPSVGSIGVSPRGGWVMPSDAVVTLWLREAESL